MTPRTWRCCAKGALGSIALAGAMPALAQDGAWRDGQPPMADAAPDRPGQPMTFAPPPRPLDPARRGAARFAAAYARAGSPRIVIFWNRELTDDVATVSEEVSTSSSAGHVTDDGWRRDGASRSETRNATRRIDPGRRDTPHGQAIDFDLERGFSDTLSGAGARLIDRTAIMRRGALGSDTVNVQAIETRAILGRAELTLEIVPLDDPRAAEGTTYKIVARDIASGRIVAMATSTGRPPAGVLPYVAGEHGFVRATPPEPTAYDKGRQLGIDAMNALAARL